ncbi:MAG: glycosyltransferase family 4 protein [Planctomycetales bacterium]|nr:glycosyltransferase family 4 protein [Planctomycetales bacterium]
MSGLRLAVVSRRFWPHADEPELWLGDLVGAMRELGARPTVVTAQWKSNWPTQAVYREVPLVRVPHTSPGGWGTLLYMRRLARWLREHRDQFDAVLVSRLRLDAYAAIGALGSSGLPIVVRAEGAGEMGDAAWLGSSTFGGRIRRRVFAASAIAVGSDVVRNELLELGAPESRVRCLPAGAAPPNHSWDAPNETEAHDASAVRRNRKQAARQSVSEACSDLLTNHDDPVFLYVGRLHRANNLTTLLRAWQHVAQRWPRAWLWFVGDGPERSMLFQRVKEAGLRQQTFMPGSFDDVDDFFEAADVLLCPARAADASPTIRRALAAGLPILASDVAGHRELLSDGGGELVSTRDAAAWAEAMLRLADNVALRADYSAAACIAASEFTLDRSAEQHLALFESLLKSPLP